MPLAAPWIAVLIAAAPPPTDEVVQPAERSSALSVVGQRLALVVGVGDYTHTSAWPRLPNAQGDAAALARELAGRYGFSVTSLAAPTAGELKAALKDLAARSEEADDVVVFFAGHGYFDPDDNAGYLVLRDGASGCASGCYPFDNLKRALYGARARHVLVILDACHAGTFDVRAAFDGDRPRGPIDDAEPLRQRVRDYARYPSRLVLASVANTLAPDGEPGSHSPFMQALLRQLARPGESGVVSLERLFVALGEDAALPVGRPVPFASIVPSHPNGTFLFIEDVPLCDALRAVVAAGREGFAALRVDTARQATWGTSGAARWTVPGTRRCDVWSWPTRDADEVRCEVGAFDTTAGPERARALFEEARACWAPGEAIASEAPSEHDGMRFSTWRLALSQGRALSVVAACGDACEVVLVVE